uniref:G-protein coupled receptors family 1 profile domain-containing protein n=1 Tax=Noctiluca scintillans TaxID=2966 RepID=A0A7S1AB34_NOCSC|mmetsp:Transcript_39070/g.103785  ORF Transcript_39070/g.103785 Transcript_39070/m.103785 type:complete len:334 (+) Transcript_39070:109-1110(+)
MSMLFPLLNGIAVVVAFSSSVLLLRLLMQLPREERSKTYNVLLSLLALSDLAGEVCQGVFLLVKLRAISGSSELCLLTGDFFHCARYLSMGVEVHLAVSLASSAACRASKVASTVQLTTFLLFVVVMLLGFISTSRFRLKWDAPSTECIPANRNYLFFGAALFTVVACPILYGVMACFTWKYPRARRLAVLTPILYLLVFLITYMPVVVLDFVKDPAHYDVFEIFALTMETLKGCLNAVAYWVIGRCISSASWGDWGGPALTEPIVVPTWPLRRAEPIRNGPPSFMTAQSGTFESGSVDVRSLSTSKSLSVPVREVTLVSLESLAEADSECQV